LFENFNQEWKDLSDSLTKNKMDSRVRGNDGILIIFPDLAPNAEYGSLLRTHLRSTINVICYTINALRDSCNI
jgi:hypothetical protein